MEDGLYPGLVLPLVRRRKGCVSEPRASFLTCIGVPHSSGVHIKPAFSCFNSSAPGVAVEGPQSLVFIRWAEGDLQNPPVPFLQVLLPDSCSPAWGAQWPPCQGPRTPRAWAGVVLGDSRP